MSLRTVELARGLGLAVLSLLLTLVACEAAVRALQGLGRLPHFSAGSLLTPNGQLNARLVRSENPILYLEFDRNDPNVNAQGYRGRAFVVAKPADMFRIVVLGDSVAYGYSVPMQDTFPALLEHRLNQDGAGRRFELLNFSVSGYGTEAQAELYETTASAYGPDLVVLAYVLNDPVPPSLLTSMNDAGQAEIQAFERLSRVSQFAAWVQLAWRQLTDGGRTRANYALFYESPEHWRAVEEALRKLARLSHEEDFRLAAVVFPLLLDYDDYPMAEYHERIRSAFVKAGIPYLDLTQAYAREGVEALRVHPSDNTHPNALGHRIAAREIQAFLNEVGALNAPGPSGLHAAEESADVR